MDMAAFFPSFRFPHYIRDIIGPLHHEKATLFASAFCEL